MGLIEVLHFGATIFMTGVIWIVQVVHYPLMDMVSSKDAALFATRHQGRIGFVVGPMMMLELITAVLLLVQSGAFVWWLNLGMLGVIWISTAALQVPCHQKLLSGFDAKVHRELVNTNWIRTLFWSLRAVLCIWMLLSI